MRRISAREARAHFADVLGSVHYGKEPVVVERNGKPFAVVISPDQYEVMEAALERAWTAVERMRERNADKSPEAVLEDVTAAVEAVREERHAARTRLPSRRR